ncbi:L,D-transpeptidase family protein [Microbacterium mangrovi]|uniref:L,D-transpeptidase family protein n=1 Tax=Microbacterium mangrovi TaxID=1348253 RepID=UPI00068A7555|nr:L,D-transpeptidase family protein [Microbacterium mangrovi]
MTHDSGSHTDDTTPLGGDVTYAWAPATPPKRKRHLGWWIGTPVAVLLVAAITSSLVLIAPGTAVAGVPVGGMTAGAAAQAIQQKLSQTTIEVAGPNGNVSLTGADLGATVDAETLAKSAYDAHPMWKVGSWFAEVKDATVTLNPATAEAALHKVAPSLFADPRNATVAYNADAAKYVVTPAVAGKGVELASVAAALKQSFVTGKTASPVAITGVTVPAATSTATAKQVAVKLNAVLDMGGFYVGSERVVPVSPATMASWLTITTDVDGKISVSADAAKIQKAVPTAAQIDQTVRNGSAIADSEGSILRVETPTQDGRTLGDTSKVAEQFAAQLEKGDGAYKLPVTVVPGKTTKIVRQLEVNLTEQRVYLKQDGKVVDSWLVSSGHDITPTFTGHYRVYVHLPVQTMRGLNVDGTKYTTPDVPWIMYFNGGEGFHGVYWHNNWGHKMSHGCVGMPISRAKQLYDWSPDNIEVWVHN